LTYSVVAISSVVLLQRLLLAFAMAPFIADVVWTLLMVLTALGYAVVMAIAVGIVDGTSRRLGSTLKFGVRVFGGMFLAAAYMVSQLIDVVFGFLPHVLALTAPLLLGSALLGVAFGLFVAGTLQLADGGIKRIRHAGV
jgi:hypothetical protein